MEQTVTPGGGEDIGAMSTLDTSTNEIYLAEMIKSLCMEKGLDAMVLEKLWVLMEENLTQLKDCATLLAPFRNAR